MSQPVCTDGSAPHWVKRLRGFIPDFCRSHAVLHDFQDSLSVMLHGSTVLGFDDEFSDLDLWLLLPGEDLERLELASRTLFFEFELGGKPGHLNANSVEAFQSRVRHCDMDVIWQLRRAEIIVDGTGAGGELVGSAARPMRKEVSQAFFFYHYVEMRGEHRACDNPMERKDPTALLLSLPKVIAHALRAALVLDGKPYPWDKWLHYAALRTPTGQLLCPHVERILDLIGAGGLQFGGTEADNPIGFELRAMRRALVERAQVQGIHGDWLDRWWLHMDGAQAAVKGIQW